MSDEYSLTTKWQRGEITTAEFWRRIGRLRGEDAHSRHLLEEQEREQAEDPAAPLVFP